TTNSFCLKLSIVPAVVLFWTVSFSAESMCKLTILPVITHVPRIVPVMPCPRVLLMKPCGRTWETNLPSALNEIPSVMSPTVPRQFPTIFAEYCAFSTVASGAHEDRTNASIRPSRLKRSIFINFARGNLDCMGYEADINRRFIGPRTAEPDFWISGPRECRKGQLCD